jgi:hypothetical protein
MPIFKLHRIFFLHKSWLTEGIFSVFLKLLGTIFQLAALRHFCHHVDETVFSGFLLFQGMISLTPFIDFGKGGLALRKKLMEFPDEGVFFNRIWQLFLIYFAWFVLYTCLTGELCFGFLLFMRIPFAMQADAFYSYGENQLRAFLDLVEALTLSLLIIIFSFLELELHQIKTLYVAVLFLNAVISYFIFLSKRRWRAQNLIQYTGLEEFFSKNDLIHCLYILVFSSYLVGFQWIVNVCYQETDLFTFNVTYKIVGLFLGAFLILLNPLINEIKRKSVARNDWIVILCLILGAQGVLIIFGHKAFSFVSGRPLQDPTFFYLMICWMGTTACVFLMDHYLRMTHIFLSVFLMGTTYVFWIVLGYLIPSITTWLVLAIGINLFSITIGGGYIREEKLSLKL